MEPLKDKVIREIKKALSCSEGMQRDEPSREISLVVTKLQEALMWAEKLD